jgi:DNA invertase Pin-like site-specific DNA recombinase
MSVSSDPRVIGYLRVATSDQGRSAGIDQQRAFLANPWISTSGQPTLPPSTRIFEDVNVSGLTPWNERPGLMALIRDAGSGEFDVVHVLSLDRLSRSRVDMHEIIANLEELGVVLYATDYHPGDTVTMAPFRLLAQAARVERQFIDERIAGLGSTE